MKNNHWLFPCVLSLLTLLCVGIFSSANSMPLDLTSIDTKNQNITVEQQNKFKSLPPEIQQQIIQKAQEKTTQKGPDIIQPTITVEPIKGPDIIQPTITVEPIIVEPKEKDTSEIEKKSIETLDQPVLKETQEQKVVHQELKQFGYDLFDGVPSTFAPANDIPVPVDYIIGPGDTIKIQLYGKANVFQTLTVNRDGLLPFPDLGPISAIGLSFEELKDYLQKLINEKMIGYKANITMGTLRSIRIFVLGEANRPGAYTVSSLSTMINALFVSGGIKPIGSLRRIELKRDGEIITKLDLYDLLLQGDTSADKRIMPGDVIFIPPIGPTVGVGGEVIRPAIYELRSKKNVPEMIKLAGGFLPTAYPKISQLERINDKGERTLVDVDITDQQAAQTAVKDGDTLRIYSVLEKMENIVFLSGHVNRPGAFQWNAGMRVSDILNSTDELLSEADLHYALIRRENAPNGRISILTIDLSDIFAKKTSSNNIKLQARDKIIVFGLNDNRPEIIKGLIDELNQQARYNEPETVVSVTGNVRFPGQYPLTGNMKVSHLLQAAADILPETDLHYALLVREEDAANRKKIVISIDLAEVLANSQSSANFELQARDKIIVFDINDNRPEIISGLIDKLKQQARYKEPEAVVSVSGYVRFPGQYPLTKGMMVSHLLQATVDIWPATDLHYALLVREELAPQKERTPNRKKSIINIDLADVFADYQSTSNLELQARDKIIVFGLNANRPEIVKGLIDDLRLQGRYDEPPVVVSVAGNVRFPGQYPLTEDMRLSDILQAAVDILPETDLDYALLVREKEFGARHQVLSFSLGALMSAPESAPNPLLQARDMFFIFSLNNEREGMLQNLINQLHKQNRSEEPTSVITVIGDVRFPGVYPLEQKMTISDLITAGGQLTESSYTQYAEITRFTITKENHRAVQHIPIDLSSIINKKLEEENSLKTDLELVAHDILSIKTIPLWNKNNYVEIHGEVMFPGKYPIARNETMSSVLQRAGGVTENAFIEAAVFLREDLRIKEQQQIDKVADQIRKDITVSTLGESQAESDAAKKEEYSLAQNLLAQLESQKAIGRLVIDFAIIASAKGLVEEDIILRNEDKLYIPSKPQEVMITGEVHFPSAHLIKKGLKINDYIENSGGFTKDADRKHTFVVRTNGMIESMANVGPWHPGKKVIYPGDTIVVPIDLERMKPITLWREVTQILSQLAVAMASGKTIGIF